MRKGHLFLPKNASQKTLGKLQLGLGGCISPDPATSPTLRMGQPLLPASWTGTRCRAAFLVPKNSAGAAHVYFL